MKQWMRKLARHYENMLAKYPRAKLMIVFDIDGTIFDSRYLVVWLLREFDREHGTDIFANLIPENIPGGIRFLRRIVEQLDVKEKEKVLEWIERNRERVWCEDAIRFASKAFPGVMAVIRWFQLQPRTFVGINTSRPEKLRRVTLEVLNSVGKEFKVRFKSELIFMRKSPDIARSKVEGIKFFLSKGYRVFAVVDDNEEYLEKIASDIHDEDILLIHARTTPLVAEKSRATGKKLVGAQKYLVSELFTPDIIKGEGKIPKRIQFVWHGINTPENLRNFLASEVEWGELDVRFSPTRKVILRHDSFEQTPPKEDERMLELERVLRDFAKFSKSAKLDLKEGGELLDEVIRIIRKVGFDETKLWFNGAIDRLGREGFRKLKREFPNAVLQCPADFLAPLVVTMPAEAKRILRKIEGWGINRVSLNWKTENLALLIGKFQDWGFKVNIYNVPDLESFLQAVLLLPDSITSDFNFPSWYYFGTGSGEGGFTRRYYER